MEICITYTHTADADTRNIGNADFINDSDSDSTVNIYWLTAVSLRPLRGGS